MASPALSRQRPFLPSLLKRWESHLDSPEKIAISVSWPLCLPHFRCSEQRVSVQYQFSTGSVPVMLGHSPQLRTDPVAFLGHSHKHCHLHPAAQTGREGGRCFDGKGTTEYWGPCGFGVSPR